MTAWISSLAGALLGVASVTSAFAADLGQAAPAYRVVPGKAASGACADPSVLSTIVTRFDYTAANALRSDIAIVEIRDMHLRRAQRKDKLHLVGRQWCGAAALTSDGVVRPMWYLIESDWAFAGTGSKTEYCLLGLDPGYVYGAHCASLQ